MSNPPKRYQDAEYKAIPGEIKGVFERAIGDRRGLYIHGPVGSGKTFVAWAIANEWEKKNRRTKFWNTTELLHEIRRDFDLPPIDKSHAADDLLAYDGLLFLDDVGAERMTEWVAETFYLVLNRRYDRMLPTIITSNLPVSELAERIGDRAASRIVEMCEVIELVGSDRRIKSHKKTKVKV